MPLPFHSFIHSFRFPFTKTHHTKFFVVVVAVGYLKNYFIFEMLVSEQLNLTIVHQPPIQKTQLNTLNIYLLLPALLLVVNSSQLLAFLFSHLYTIFFSLLSYYCYHTYYCYYYCLFSFQFQFT